MKCLILAGGSGDRLWPLSRKKYPKQFMEMNENRSLLQETIVHNLPFCEEFLIVTNESYDFILEGQLKAFQGLRYRSFLEQEGRKTAAAIALVCMMENPTELIHVVSADTLVEGAGYQEAVLRAKELAKKGSLVAFGIPVTEPNTAYGYIRHQGEQVLAFVEKPDKETASAYMQSGEYLWNSGSFLFRADTLLRELKRWQPQVYEQCRKLANRHKKAGSRVVFEKAMLQTVPKISIEKAIFEKSDKTKVIPATFSWRDIGRLEDLENAPIHTNSANIIQKDCTGSTIINQSHNRVVVANGLDDMMVVNTEDATYIGKKGQSDALKEILRSQEGSVCDFFENHPVTYRPYGTYQVLAASEGYQVKKVTIYPGCSIGFHRHQHRSEHWSIVEGSVEISIGFRETDELHIEADSNQNVSEREMRTAVPRVYHMSESVFVPVGVPHKVSNQTDKNVVIIEVGIGQIVKEEDIIRFQEPKRQVPMQKAEPIVKLLPAYKDYLWGGNRLREQFSKKSDLERIAESWELSAHEAGQSIVAEGLHKGMLFGEYLQLIGKEAWGWKCQAFEEFPILIKLLDAKEDLSIQVHPDDEYAMTNEGEYGKNEMWYVMDCEPDSGIYYGFAKDLTPEEIQARVKDGTLTQVLQELSVSKGDGIFIPAGTVHAIKGGMLLCEIQQNSNSTYRLFDYNRKDAYDNLRPLHVKKALDVLDLQAMSRQRMPIVTAKDSPWTLCDGYRMRSIGSCKYFESMVWELQEEAKLEVEDASFVSLLFLDGQGTIETEGKLLSYKKGDSFFVPAGRKSVQIRGEGTCVVTRV